MKRDHQTLRGEEGRSVVCGTVSDDARMTYIEIAPNAPYKQSWEMTSDGDRWGIFANRIEKRGVSNCRRYPAESRYLRVWRWKEGR